MDPMGWGKSMKIMEYTSGLRCAFAKTGYLETIFGHTTKSG
jgi:hypothetical protein